MDGKNRGTTTVVGLCSISMLKNIFRTVTLYMCLGSMIACAQTQPGASAAPKLETDDQKTLYALGLLLGSNVKPFALTSDELAIVKAGLTDGVTGAKPQVELDQYGPKVKELAQKRAAAGAEEAKKKGQEFADNVAKQKDASKTASGLVIRTEGIGPNPSATDVVKVHYIMWSGQVYPRKERSRHGSDHFQSCEPIRERRPQPSATGSRSRDAGSHRNGGQGCPGRYRFQDRRHRPCQHSGYGPAAIRRLL